MTQIRSGSFIRVKSTSDFRPGQDGMVCTVDGDTLGLFFGADRHNVIQNTECVGTEAWHISELDTSTIEH